MADSFVLSEQGAAAVKLYKQAKALAQLQVDVATDALTLAVAREVEKETSIDIVGKGIAWAVDDRGVVHFLRDGQAFDIMQLAVKTSIEEAGTS